MQEQKRGKFFPFHRLVRLGESAAVGSLMDVGAQQEKLLSRVDEMGRLPLHVAAVWGREEVAQLLLSHSTFDPHALLIREEHYGHTPLQCAAYFGHAKVFLLILEQISPSLFSSEEQGRLLGCGSAPSPTVLHDLARQALFQEISHLLSTPWVQDLPQEIKQCLWEKRGEKGQTPFHFASQQKETQTVLTLLDFCETEEELKKRDDYGRHLLHHVALSGGQFFQEWKLSHPFHGVLSSLWKVRDHVGRSPLHCLVKEGEEKEILSFLSSPFAQSLSLEERALCLGADVNGYTPLHLLAREGKTSCIPLFLSHQWVQSVGEEQLNQFFKGDVHNGQTPLHHALFQGHTETFFTLLDSPLLARFSKEQLDLLWASDRMGSSPLHRMVAGGKPGEVSRLLSHPLLMEVSLATKQQLFGKERIFGQTPLHLAVQRGEAEILKEFLTHPLVANLSGEERSLFFTLDSEGCSIWTLVASLQSLSCLKLLLDCDWVEGLEEALFHCFDEGMPPTLSLFSQEQVGEILSHPKSSPSLVKKVEEFLRR